MSKTIKTKELEIVVSRWWPTHLIRSVEIKRNDLDYGANCIKIDAEQTEQLLTALLQITKPEVSQEGTK